MAQKGNKFSRSLRSLDCGYSVLISTPVR